MKEKFDINDEKKKLVLARFKTLNPESKILLGGNKEIDVKELIDHIEKGDDFGKKIIQVQMKMLKILSSNI